MTADFPVILDACVLANYSVCDLFLRLAETPRLVVPRWSDEILRETCRTLEGPLRWPKHLVDSWLEEVTAAFPEALIANYEGLIPAMENDEKDRHVLAAAVMARVSLIITFNIKHFSPAHLTKWGVVAEHPQDYLSTLYSMSPGIMMVKLEEIARNKGCSVEDVLLELRKSVPLFSDQILDDLNNVRG